MERDKSYAGKLLTELLFFFVSWLIQSRFILQTVNRITRQYRKDKGNVRFLKKHWWGVLYSLFLTIFTAYTFMDTFLVSRVYVSVEETKSTESEETQTKAVVSENSYSDENIQITVTEYREEDTNVYVADITLSSPEYLQTALARNAYGKNVTAKTSETAESVHAILAINGDYYGAQEAGYVIRGGVLYRDTAQEGQEDLVLYEDGTMGIISEDQVSAEELLEDGAKEVLSFGPALITQGEIAVEEDDEVGKAMASNPRTAIGVIDDLHYVFVVADGRTEESEDFPSGTGRIYGYAGGDNCI